MKANQQTLFVGDPDERTERQAKRQELLQTISWRGSRQYTLPTIRPGTVEYDAYLVGFHAGARQEKLPTLDYESDRQQAYLREGFRHGALLRPLDLERPAQATRTRDGSKPSAAFGKHELRMYPTRSIAR